MSVHIIQFIKSLSIAAHSLQLVLLSVYFKLNHQFEIKFEITEFLDRDLPIVP